MGSRTIDIKPFLNENFLLENEVAGILYHNYAKHQPIIDYHNHLSPCEIAKGKTFSSLTEAWLDGDHYKWRAMRAFGIEEKYITGKASDIEKFKKWAQVVPYTIRNPLFHWTHLELKRYFEVEEPLNPSTAESIYNHCNALLQKKEFNTHGLLEKMNVRIVCTTDDPVDDLRCHEFHSKADSPVKLFPAFRPDKAILIGHPGFQEYVEKLAKVMGQEIPSFQSLVEALYLRMEYFHVHGCRLSDHGLDKAYSESFTMGELEKIFKDRISGGQLSGRECECFASGMMVLLGRKYAEMGWVMQLHLGAMRNNNTRMVKSLGPDTGFDSIGDQVEARSLARYLDSLDRENKLPKTIIYNLNPRDNAVFASMAGNFYEEGIKGKVQFGSAWWFLDQKDGMENQLNTLSNMGLLSNFIGMLTDSRSFLSFPRHEYFRRILCNLIGKDVCKGELPYDEQWLGSIVNDICYFNAKNYFDFD